MLTLDVGQQSRFLLSVERQKPLQIDHRQNKVRSPMDYLHGLRIGARYDPYLKGGT
jgi:hypothetical protein